MKLARVLGFVCAVSFSMQDAFANDDLKIRIGEIETKSNYLAVQSKKLPALIKEGLAGVKKNPDGSIDGLNFLEIRKLNNSAAKKIMDEADVLHSEAVAFVAMARSSPFFVARESGESATIADRVFATLQQISCVRFSTELISNNQDLPAAISLAETVAKDCDNVVRLVRKERTGSSAATKKK